VHNRITDSRGVWLVAGVIIGLGVTWFWPHEPIRADQSDRTDKFGICTVPASLAIAGLPSSEAVFILDFVTGRLQGFYLNPQQGGFTQMFYRDIADDLRLNEKGAAQPVYAFVGGQGQYAGQGQSWGASILYVAEMTTGKLVAYAFPFSQANAGTPQQMVPVANAQFRAAAAN
jgi:hypothetical protein